MRDIIDIGMFSLEIIVSIALGLTLWFYLFQVNVEIHDRMNNSKFAVTSDCSYTLRGAYTQYRGKPVCKTVPRNKDL